MKQAAIGILVFALSSLSAGAANPAANSEDAKSFRAQVDGWVAAGQKEKQECMKYAWDLWSVGKGKSGPSGYRDKKTAMTALEKISRYPTSPAPSGALIERIMKPLPSGVDYAWLDRSIRSAPRACDPFGSFDALNTVINGSRLLKYSPSEHAELKKTSLDFISKNLSQPGTLLPLLLQTSLLTNLVSTGDLHPSAKAQADLKKLAAEGEKLHAELSKRAAKKEKRSDRESVEAFIAEAKSADAYRTKLRALLKELISNPASQKPLTKPAAKKS